MCRSYSKNSHLHKWAIGIWSLQPQEGKEKYWVRIKIQWIYVVYMYPIVPPLLGSLACISLMPPYQGANFRVTAQHMLIS